MNITKQDKNLIAEAVAQAEEMTSGEVVPVILKRSDDYPAAHFRLCLIFGVLASLLTYEFYDFNDPLVLLWSQVPGFILGYALAFIPAVKRLMTSKAKMTEEVHQRALEVFHEHQVSNTRDRTGIVIFISLLEKKVEVIADIGISEKVEKDYWQKLVDQLISHIKTKSLREGLVAAIMACGHLLSQHFPIKDDDTNEVANKLVTD